MELWTEIIVREEKTYTLLQGIRTKIGDHDLSGNHSWWATWRRYEAEWGADVMELQHTGRYALAWDVKNEATRGDHSVVRPKKQSLCAHS